MMKIETDLGEFEVEIVNVQEIDDESEFGHLVFENGEMPFPTAFVRHESGEMFVTLDWQMEQPETIEDIPDHEWMDFFGEDAVIVDGLPK
jgi:hypothetical protein